MLSQDSGSPAVLPLPVRASCWPCRSIPAMRMLVWLLAGLVASAAQAETVVKFKGRSIDLDPYLDGFPYTNPIVSLRGGKLFYLRKGKTSQLMMQSFDPSSRAKVDLANGRVISPRDFASRSWWGAEYSPLTRSVVIQADENNDEIINLYSLDPDTGAERQLTHTSYIYGWQMSEDRRRIAYVTRATKDELSPSDVRVLDLVSGADRVVHKDSPERKIVWTGVSWQPSGRGLILRFNVAGDRRRGNLAYLPLDGSAPRVLGDVTKKRYSIEALPDWIDDDQYLYLSDESGVTGVYRGSLAGGAPRLVTAADENVKGAVLLSQGARRVLAVISGDPMRSVLSLRDPRSGAVRKRETFEGLVDFADAHQGRAAMSITSLTVPFKDLELHLEGEGYVLFDRVTYPEELLRKIVHCEVEKVSFETFDRLSAPGEKGTLHAYLLKPKRPLPKGEQRALVLSFYGGGNAFWTGAEVLCEAGHYVMSPAPRGSADFGSAFYDLAAGDWGGAETLDDFAAGRYLERRLGIPPRRIGIFGHSRGGYDTMRALTFPGTVNGVKEDFRFGFGIAQSGISDILRAAKEGNISQWYANLTGGDPAKDAARWRDRSPEAHADLISGPLLLTHGTNDQRVPIAESRAMYRTLKALGKDVTLVELEGQGHGYSGRGALTQYYRALLGFLEKLQ